MNAAAIWDLLRKASQGQDPWRIVSLCTWSFTGPQSRNVVLRQANAELNTLTFYTDKRSDKVSELQHDNRVSLLFWNAETKTQLRVNGQATVLMDSDLTQAFWDQLPNHSKLEYAQTSRPGSHKDHQSSPLPVEQARNYFAVITVQAKHMDYLVLAREGHTRYRFDLKDKNWIKQELIP